MTQFVKGWLLFLYWLPNIVRCLWRDSRGGFFIFRNEPDELLGFLHLCLHPLRDRPEDPLYSFYWQVLIEIGDRERVKALRDALRALGY